MASAHSDPAASSASSQSAELASASPASTAPSPAAAHGGGTTTIPAHNLHSRSYSTGRLWWEIALVLLVSFGRSGLRAIFQLVDALLATSNLNEQATVLYSQQSQSSWLDIALQLCSALTLCAWGGLAAYLLWASHNWSWPTWRALFRGRSWAQGAGLAALIGLPGLGLYILALQMGWTKYVIPASFEQAWWELPVLWVHSFANAFAEEMIVVAFLVTRLRQLDKSWALAIGASALLRASYHLYQGVSAGFGNLLMGLIFAAFYAKTGKVWPLIIAHFLIDAVAFSGYALGASSWGFIRS
ncbi:MAG: CPBP family intramembrane metalloprotease [Corynebacterium sp.]|nr:CPBP family intramembrane metalloprotease [Corynebacterium sp.]